MRFSIPWRWNTSSNYSTRHFYITVSTNGRSGEEEKKEQEISKFPALCMLSSNEKAGVELIHPNTHWYISKEKLSSHHAYFNEFRFVINPPDSFQSPFIAQWIFYYGIRLENRRQIIISHGGNLSKISPKSNAFAFWNDINKIKPPFWGLATELTRNLTDTFNVIAVFKTKQWKLWDTSVCSNTL